MSSGTVDPFSNPQAWDVITVAGVASPGKCDVSDCKTAYDWDVKKGKGVRGATVTFLGRPPAKFHITFQLWTAAHFAAWDAFRPLFKYDPAKKQPNAIDIYHPALADIEISSVVCEGIGTIIHKGGQLYELVIDFLEYLPPVKSIGTPGKSVYTQLDKGPGTQPTSATDADQKTAADLLKQASAP